MTPEEFMRQLIASVPSYVVVLGISSPGWLNPRELQFNHDGHYLDGDIKLEEGVLIVQLMPLKDDPKSSNFFRIPPKTVQDVVNRVCELTPNQPLPSRVLSSSD
jgi:hypothetical protein